MTTSLPTALPTAQGSSAPTKAGGPLDFLFLGLGGAELAQGTGIGGPFDFASLLTQSSGAPAAFAQRVALDSSAGSAVSPKSKTQVNATTVKPSVAATAPASAPAVQRDAMESVASYLSALALSAQQAQAPAVLGTGAQARAAGGELDAPAGSLTTKSSGSGSLAAQSALASASTPGLDSVTASLGLGGILAEIAAEGSAALAPLPHPGFSPALLSTGAQGSASRGELDVPAGSLTTESGGSATLAAQSALASATISGLDATTASLGAEGILVRIAAGDSVAQTSSSRPGLPAAAGSETGARRQTESTHVAPAGDLPSTGVVAPSTDTNPGPAPYAEKFAATTDGAVSSAKMRNGTGIKNFLGNDSKLVMETVKGDGIDIAKSTPNMRAAFTTNPSAVTSPGADASHAAVGSLQGGTAALEVTSQAPAGGISPTLAPVLAERAVQTVLNVVDAQQSNALQGGSVKLDFNFGGQALAVHVQMRGGEVHTEFRTSSPELRTALSNEWRIAEGQRSPDGVKLAEPVFSSGNGGSSTANGGSPQQDFSFQQRNPQQQHQPAEQTAFARVGRTPVTPTSDVPEDLPSSSPVTIPTSVHLAAMA